MTGPDGLILLRAEAFRRCDFGFIFDSYHPDSNFRRQFSDREEYVRYGWSSLGKDFRIVGCRILRMEVEGLSARVIHLLAFEVNGLRQEYAELSWLDDVEGEWLVRCGQKLLPEEWPVPLEELAFSHFDTLPEKVLY